MNGDARVAFLAGLIDDAGLFPPASLSMEEAVASHQGSRNGANGWMLARFVCPASRLEELRTRLPDEGPAGPWRVSVILDGTAEGQWLQSAAADIDAARAFAEEVPPRARVEAIEARLPEENDAELVRTLVETAQNAGLTATPFLEVPSGASVPETLRRISEARARIGGANSSPVGAKLRCGGPTPELFPAPARVASFIDASRRLGIPFKCTAALHHPFRHTDPVTGGVQHGFMNLVGATVLAHAHGLDAAETEEIVGDDDASSFSLGPEGFVWRNLPASASAISAARANAFIAYGSCSFEEPVDDLTRLAILPV